MPRSRCRWLRRIHHKCNGAVKYSPSTSPRSFASTAMQVRIDDRIPRSIQSSHCLFWPLIARFPLDASALPPANRPSSRRCCVAHLLHYCPPVVLDGQSMRGRLRIASTRRASAKEDTSGAGSSPLMEFRCVDAHQCRAEVPTSEARLMTRKASASRALCAWAAPI